MASVQFIGMLKRSAMDILMRTAATILFFLALFTSIATAQQKAARIVTTDQFFLFDQPMSIIGSTVTLRRASCVFLGASAMKDTLCEAKGSGGKSVVIYATSSIWDTDAEKAAANYLERNCSGTANLGTRQCFFQITTDVRSMGPVKFVETGLGSIAAREVFSGPAKLLRR